MSLRTYPLVTHPAFIAHINSVENQLPFVQDENQLPKLQYVSDIGYFLGVSPLNIGSMIRNKAKHYNAFSVRKRSGGERIIHAPRTFLKVVQWWILDTILERVSDNDCVYGFRKGRSFIDNARVHLNQAHILNVDVKDFFPSISVEHVEQIFREFGYTARVANGLAELITYDMTLPQGAPTSPKISNIIFGPIDKKISAFCQRNGYRYSRYADDLTISSNTKIPLNAVGHIAQIIKPSGFRLNSNKTKFMGCNQRKEVTGLIIGETDVALSRSYLNAARGWFFSIMNYPEIYLPKYHRAKGTLELIKQVGGRGSKSVIKLGNQAISALEANKPPEIKWDD